MIRRYSIDNFIHAYPAHQHLLRASELLSSWCCQQIWLFTGVYRETTPIDLNTYSFSCDTCVPTILLFVDEHSDIDLLLTSTYHSNSETHEGLQLIVYGHTHSVTSITHIARLYAQAERRQHITLYQDAANTTINYTYIGVCADQSRMTTAVAQRHDAAYTQSTMDYRVAVFDTSYDEYTGIITLGPQAPHSQAYQHHKALLMSGAARAYAQPSLEALNPDVQCGHGSAIGQCSEQELFYLATRGCSPKRAEYMLLNAFLAHNLSVSAAAIVEQYVIDITSGIR